MPKYFVLLLTLIITSCVDFPNQYAPARARRPDTGPDPRGLKSYIDMKDPASLAHIAWGINPAAFDGEKRKAESKAALRFKVDDTANLKVSIDIATPQLLRLKVNGRPVGEATSTHFEALVEPTDFFPNTATLVEIESDSGFSLLRVGFLKR